MTKKQVLNFFKAPFSKSFVVAFAFSFFSLLAVPLVSAALFTFLDEIEEIYTLSDEDAAKLFFTSLMERVDAYDVTIAVIGVIVAYFLFSLYYFLLVHKTVEENKGIFDVSRISLKTSEVFATALKYFCFVLIYCGGLILPFLPPIILTILGFSISHAVGVVTLIAGFVAFFYLFYKMFCHLYTASLIFYKEFDLGVFFERKRVKEFFVSHKENILISFLLTYVFSQILYVICSSVCWNVIQNVLSANMVLELFDMSSQIFASIGLVVFNFVFVYVTILHAIVFGKVILWVEKKKVEKA